MYTSNVLATTITKRLFSPSGKPGSFEWKKIKCSFRSKCSVSGFPVHVLKSSTVLRCSDVLSCKGRLPLLAWGVGGGVAVRKGSNVYMPAASALSQGISNTKIMAMDNCT